MESPFDDDVRELPDEEDEDELAGQACQECGEIDAHSVDCSRFIEDENEPEEEDDLTIVDEDDR